MNSVNIYSEKNNEIKKFLELFYTKNFNMNNIFSYNKEFDNPIEMIDLISCFVDNNDKFEISIWISIDEGIYIKINENNINSIIKYLYERYPW